MKKLKFLFSPILFLALILAFSSCNRGPLFEKYLKMKNSTWDRFDIKQYDLPITEPAVSYDITVVVRCNEKFQYDKLPFYVILTTPAGEERMREVNVPVRDNGRLITEPNETQPESRLVLWNGISMAEKGKCKITLENMIPKIQTEGIDEIGIVMTKTE